jgi:predicted transcriptional regulator
MPRKPSPTLTDAEARIMSVLWQHGEATVADVVRELSRRRPATYSTVQTLLRILETKGYAAHDKIARAFIYRPLLDERQARRHALRHLVSGLFDGSPSLLVLNMLDDEDLDPAELERVKKLIEEA